MTRRISKPEIKNTKNAFNVIIYWRHPRPVSFFFFFIWILEDFQLNVKYPLIQLIYNTL